MTIFENYLQFLQGTIFNLIELQHLYARGDFQLALINFDSKTLQIGVKCLQCCINKILVIMSIVKYLTVYTMIIKMFEL